MASLITTQEILALKVGLDAVQQQKVERIANDYERVVVNYSKQSEMMKAKDSEIARLNAQIEDMHEKALQVERDVAYASEIKMNAMREADKIKADGERIKQKLIDEGRNDAHKTLSDAERDINLAYQELTKTTAQVKENAEKERQKIVDVANARADEMIQLAKDKVEVIVNYGKGQVELIKNYTDTISQLHEHLGELKAQPVFDLAVEHVANIDEQVEEQIEPRPQLERAEDSFSIDVSQGKALDLLKGHTFKSLRVPEIDSEADKNE